MQFYNDVLLGNTYTNKRIPSSKQSSIQSPEGSKGIATIFWNALIGKPETIEAKKTLKNLTRRLTNGKEQPEVILNALNAMNIEKAPSLKRQFEQLKASAIAKSILNNQPYSKRGSRAFDGDLKTSLIYADRGSDRSFSVCFTLAGEDIEYLETFEASKNFWEKAVDFFFRKNEIKEALDFVRDSTKNEKFEILNPQSKDKAIRGFCKTRKRVGFIFR